MTSDVERHDSQDQSVRNGRDLTTGSIPRHLFVFSLPMLAGNALQMSYALVNAFWVERGLGSDSMAAITVSFPAFFVLISVAIGLTMAAGILASQAYGAKDFSRFRRVVQNSAVLTGVSSLLCTGASYLLAEAILRVISTPEEIIPMATLYLRIFVWHIPFAFGYFLLASLLRAVGDSKTPLYFQSSFLLLTAILDPLLMFGWLGFPKLGLNGTAYATIIGNVGTFVSMYGYLAAKRHLVTPHMRELRADLPTSRLIVKIGLPAMFQNSLVSVSILVITALVNSFGTLGVAAFGVASRIDQFAFLPAMTIGMAVSMLAGQNIGAERYDRVHQVFGWGVLLSWAITLPAIVAFVSIPHTLLSGFTTDREVIDLGVRYLRIVGAGYVLLSVLFVSNGIINGAGRTLVTTLTTAVGLWLARVPVATYLSKRLDSLDGIWYGMLVGTAVGMLMSLGYYRFGKWKSPVYADMPDGRRQGGGLDESRGPKPETTDETQAARLDATLPS